ncbi:MAG: transpeptidase family protein [Deltaproteobacteria bacterium]|nr:transpeptidase family protein [Deltaproteobacteria bacterium]
MRARVVVGAPLWRTMSAHAMLRRRMSANPVSRRESKPRARSRIQRRRPSERLLEIMAATNEATRRGEEAVSPRARIACVGVVMLLAIGFVVARAVELQVTDGRRYEAAARKQAMISARVKAKRGAIRDRHGKELAITVDVDSVYAEPNRVDDPQAAEKLARTLGLPVRTVAQKLARRRSFVYIQRRVDANAAAKVRALGLRGVGTRPEPKRFYSNMNLAAHVVGFTNLDGEGVAGVERLFDDDLKGKSYLLSGLRDALGQKVLSEGFVPSAVLEGADLDLTIDRQIQFAADEALREAVDAHEAKGGVALVLEVATGDVLAMSSYPTFNPNNLARSTPNDHLNRAIGAVYDPGSTVKVVTIAGALSSGVVSEGAELDCESGKFRIGRRTIRDSNHAYGVLSLSEIMKVSSNICAAKLGLALGRDRLHQWLVDFGLGVRTGIELPGELEGLVRPKERWRDIDVANIAFGQGLAVTPLQIAQATSVVASGGLRRSPRLVRAVVDKDGSRRTVDRPAPVRVISEETARAVTSMMVGVTQEGGTAPLAAVPGFEVAGKTGTAQKIDPVTRAYSRELHVASFVGFVPAARPEVVILVLVDEPRRGGYYGGVVAAPAFQKIAVAALAAREIFPDDPVAREAFLDGHRSLSGAATENEAAAASLRVDSKANVGADPDELWFENNHLEARSESATERALAAGLSKSARAVLGEDVHLGVSEEDGELGAAREATASVPFEPEMPSAEEASSVLRMPNFAGLGPREVIDRSAKVRCDPRLVGSGRVVAQRPKPGTVISSGDTCEVTLAGDKGTDPRGPGPRSRG